MHFAELFVLEPTLWVSIVFILGLLIGSFLNVVIYRLPIMMEREWRLQAEALLGTSTSPQHPPPYNLIVPRSACPQCSTQLKAIENIPLISWLILKGRCARCSATISVRYPLIEFATAVLSGVVAWQFGFSLHTAAALLLTWVLIVLSSIDFEHQLLPDTLTLPLLWIGLTLSLLNGQVIPTSTDSALIGALAGYLSLWLVYQLFKLTTGKEGMGYGDFKLLAALGAWLGWQYLPLIILLSACVGATVGIGLIVFGGRDRHIPIPFGPYLAAAGWIALLWGEQIVSAYIRFLQSRT